MSGLVQRLDDWGKPAWITAMVIGFVVFWPVGLLILFFMLRSGRMGCSAQNGSWHDSWNQNRAARWDRRMERMKERMAYWQTLRDRAFGGAEAPFAPSGNRAFDEYRSATIRRLEQEAQEFRDFLDHLRHAKDRAEFEQFMQTRTGKAADPNADDQKPG